MVLKKNSLDLDNVKPECEHIRNELVNANKEIATKKEEYEYYNKKLLLSKPDAVAKADLGHELYELNIHAIALIQELAMCQEGRKLEDRY